MTEREKLLEVMAEALKRLPCADVIVPADVWTVDYATAALTALEAAGVRLVPVEASREMKAALMAKSPLNEMRCKLAWDYMLAASPYVPEGTRND